MSRVIARCPNCGVEHDDATGGPCEVCGTTLRFWCRLHGAETGWLASPECARCAAEAEARRSRPVPPPAAPPAAPPRRRTRVERPYAPPAEPARDPREVFRESAEDLRPYVVAGGAMAGRMIRAVFAVIRNVIIFGILGAMVGGFVAYNQRGDLVWPVISGALIGAGVGLFFGLIGALRILFSGPRRVR